MSPELHAVVMAAGLGRRLRPLTDPRALELEKRRGEGERVRRDPADMLALLLPV